MNVFEPAKKVMKLAVGISNADAIEVDKLKQTPMESSKAPEELMKIPEECEVIEEDLKKTADEPRKYPEEPEMTPPEEDSFNEVFKTGGDKSIADSPASQGKSKESMKMQVNSPFIQVEALRLMIDEGKETQSVGFKEGSIITDSNNFVATLKINDQALPILEEEITKPDETEQKEQRKAEDSEKIETFTRFAPKLVVRNADLIGKLIQNFHPYPSNWSQIVYHKPYTLVELSHVDREYAVVESKFRATCSNRRIIKIERIQNPYLAAQFQLKKAYKESLGMCRIIEVFHGTRPEFLDSICRNNLDWRNLGATGFLPNKFGNGVSFSPFASYASKFPRGHSGQVRRMLLCDAIIYKKCVGNSSTDFPRKPYDATGDKIGNVVVKYDDNEFYPKHIIHYM